MSNIAVRQQPKFSVAIQTTGYQKLINSTLQDPKRAARFTAAIMSAVAVNPTLQECEAGSILSSALLGESLNLSPSPQLGQYYLVPYDVKTGQKDASGKDIKIRKAQFQLGYKGYIQLAIRSGQYKKLNVVAIKKGELTGYDPLAEEAEIKLIEDDIKRETTETIGYFAFFEYLNGFRKAMYWSKQKMESHALRYSKGYAVKKGYTFWEKDFDSMAFKTMLRQIISKWGIMSIDMQDAFEADIKIENQDFIGDIPDYEPDNQPDIPETPEQEVKDNAQPGEQQTISMNDI